MDSREQKKKKKSRLQGSTTKNERKKLSTPKDVQAPVTSRVVFRDTTRENFMPYATQPQNDKSSTVDSPNRAHHKQLVESEWRLPEFGTSVAVHFQAPNGDVWATGFNRIVYGDHGPYLEFTDEQLNWNVLTKKHKPHPLRYYDEWYSADGYVLIQHQVRTVADKPNPPPGEHSTFNNRPEGYADYQVGYNYVALLEITNVRTVNPESRN
eukprot:TRINITY_DN84417_c0_g1_i1.p1 TRINITY_DN84417_c0_g1~~TRINITY_DN84417_c0_g1_i1.p1  ORF type:complete len:210 (-),score=24.36 TRINITY_DN84417_c0_g1_i1:403-1032(-)